MNKQIAICFDVAAARAANIQLFLKDNLENVVPKSIDKYRNKADFEVYAKKTFDERVLMYILEDFYHSIVANSTFLNIHAKNKLHYFGTLEGVEKLVIHLKESDYYDFKTIWGKILEFAYISKYLEVLDVQVAKKRNDTSELDENEMTKIGYFAKEISYEDSEIYLGWHENSNTLIQDYDKNTVIAQLAFCD